jgi:hypothetical protein
MIGRNRHIVAFIAAIGLLCASSIVFASTASATRCPGPNVGGTTIGWIEVDEKRVPLKAVKYAAGGELDPPASAAVAGVSSRHRPLLAKQGSTVIAWHVRFGPGCQGALNPLLNKKVGDTFDIVTIDGERQTYALVERRSIKRGAYQPEWFRTNGSPQVSLFTCSDLRNGRFQKTTALFAEPVN